MNKTIRIRGAREHNLKNVNVDIPRDKLVVLTGLSGSGKSSLAFDTIYAEGQRRYVESLSSYARQFLGQMEKPDVDSIEGLSPAISIDQKTTSHNPRSTVGTVTEIYDYLRLLYARTGQPHCPNCHKPIQSYSVDTIVDAILSLPQGTKLMLMAPLVRHRKGSFKKLFEDCIQRGFARVRVDGSLYTLEEVPVLEKNKKHTIEIVVDRIVLKDGIRSRLTDSVELALSVSDGLLELSRQTLNDQGKTVWEDQLYSQNNACPDCSISLGEIGPRHFSFNSPQGACQACTGLGVFKKIDPDLILQDRKLSLQEGVIRISGWNFSEKGTTWGQAFIESMAKYYGFSLDCPFDDLDETIQDKILYGTKDEKFPVDTSKTPYPKEGPYIVSFEGVIPILERRYKESSSEAIRSYYESFMTEQLCADCQGARLRKESLAVLWNGVSIDELCRMPLRKCLDFLEKGSKTLGPSHYAIAERILTELKARLQFLIDVGLDYMSLSRASSTLSGGESQRIRLATQIGSGLQGVLYILDEPSIGLHQRDNQRLLDTLKSLRDLGNSVLIVEHDEETMLEADYIIDMGPLAGEHGGEVIAKGSVQSILKAKNSLTADYLSGRKYIPIPKERRKGNGSFLKIKGAKENNLKSVNVDIPLGTLCCVTGVSGSGKSSLVNGVILRALEIGLNSSIRKRPLVHSVKGFEALDKVIAIDQSPIGRTPRSNPATYTGVFDLIRALYAELPSAKRRGYKPGRFSFNVKGGRCEACSGDGVNKIEMHFLPDIYVPCETCKGARYNRETLEVTYKSATIADVLAMTVDEACLFFENQPRILAKLQTLSDVGLGYIRLGQPSTQLSGGEAQRIKLAFELSKRATGKTFYILDEPTTGLHIADVHKLCDILQRLTESGNTVLVIEHNLDLIKIADYIVDLGPEGGAGGGLVVAAGSPEEVAQHETSYTGRYLKKLLSKNLTK